MDVVFAAHNHFYARMIPQDGIRYFVSGNYGRTEGTVWYNWDKASRFRSNINAVLNAAGCARSDIVKVTLILADIRDFQAVDQIYAAWLPGLGVTALPARTAFAVASLPAGALVMLDVIAVYPGD